MQNQSGMTGNLLIIAAGILGLGTVGWLAVASPTAGGALLCLIPAAIVVIGLVMGGLYLNSQGKAAAVETATMEQQWAWRDEERRARTYVADRLSRSSERLKADGSISKPLIAEMESLEDQLRRPSYDQGVPPPMTETTFQTLQSIDRGLMAKADELDKATDDVLRGHPEDLTDDLGQIRVMVDRRNEAVLGEARLKSAREVLATDAPSITPRASVGDMTLNDAASANGIDYSVTGRLHFDDRGTIFDRYQLRGGGQERWLLVLNGGLDSFWLTPRAVPDGLFETADWGAEQGYALRGRGIAETNIEGMGGARRGLLIDYRRFSGREDSLLWAERWPDNQRFTFDGERVGKYELEIFPGKPDAT